MRDELLNEVLLFTIGQARSILARWVDEYNTERARSSLGYATPAAFAAELENWSVSGRRWTKDGGQVSLFVKAAFSKFSFDRRSTPVC